MPVDAVMHGERIPSAAYTTRVTAVTGTPAEPPSTRDGRKSSLLSSCAHPLRHTRMAGVHPVAGALGAGVRLFFSPRHFPVLSFRFDRNNPRGQPWELSKGQSTSRRL